MSKLLVNVTGGQGLNVAVAQVLKEASLKYDKIYVVSPYQDVFRTNPYVDRVYDPVDTASAFEDVVDEDTFIAAGRVYDYSDFIQKKLNYSDAFRRWLGLPEKHEALSSNKTEVKDDETFQKIADQVEDQIFHKLKDKKYKNFVLMQMQGGQSSLSDWQHQPYDYKQQPLKRYYENAQKFIDLFRKAHPETAIVYYGLPNEPRYAGTEQFVIPYMAYTYLAKSKKCKGAVTIDSSLQHMISGVTNNIVLWAHSLPTSFGYSHNINIIQNCKRDNIRFFSLLGRAGNAVDEIKPEVLMKIVEDNIYGEFKPGVIKTNVEGEIVE